MRISLFVTKSAQTSEGSIIRRGVGALARVARVRKDDTVGRREADGKTPKALLDGMAAGLVYKCGRGADDPFQSICELGPVWLSGS